MEIRLGEHIRYTNEESIITKDFNVDYILKHPSYGSPQYSNDIALVRLAEEADISVYTPACLPDTNEDFTGQMALLTGWGVLYEYDEYSEYSDYESDTLQELDNLPIVSDASCSSSVENAFSGVVTSDMLCAGGEAGKDGCVGDKGGPLVVENSSTSQKILVGVAANLTCAGFVVPSIYSEVSSK